MLTKGARRNGHPVHFHNDTTESLNRLLLDDKDFNEAWIQQLIHNHPGLLPVSEIEPSFSPLIAVGREISTAAGYLDNLYVSPDGYITIVETKLWRNPEARREVVGQIIDYAKELSKWKYTDLNNAVMASNRLYLNNGNSLIDMVLQQADLDEYDQQAFIDNISKNLKRGRFLLLIVGDGIRESVEDMIDYLGQSPQLHFTLALVELQVFRLGQDNSSLIILPQVVTRTKEIIRAIVRIEGASAADLKINIETDLGMETDNKKVNAHAKLTLTAEDFFDQLQQNTNIEIAVFAKQIIKDAEASGYFIDWNSGSYSVKFFDPGGSGIKISLFIVDRNGLVYLGYSQWALTKLGLPLELSYDLARDTADLLPGIDQSAVTRHTWNKYARLLELRQVYPAFMERVKKYVDDISLAGQVGDIGP